MKGGDDMNIIPMTTEQKQLAEEHLYLVPKMVCLLTNAYSGLATDERDELHQIGYYALCRAAMKYDNQRDFVPYARSAIRYAIYDNFRSKRQQHNMFCSLDALLTDTHNYDFVENSINRKYFQLEDQKKDELSEDVSAYLRTLESQNCSIIQKGINSLCMRGNGYTTSELAKFYGVSSNHIRAWQSKARKQLREDQELYELLA